MTRKLPAVETLAESLRNGATMSELAEEYGASVSAVSATFKRAGIVAEAECAECGRLCQTTRGSLYCSPQCGNRARRRRRPPGSERIPPSIYGVHFTDAGLLKIGFTTYRNHAGHASARARASFDVTGGRRIWLRPGDYRTESFVQAWLAFRYSQPEHDNRRMSEWFYVGDLDSEAIAAELDEILTHIPKPARTATEVLAVFRGQHVA